MNRTKRKARAKAVAVAKDVLKHLKRYHIEAGDYIQRLGRRNLPSAEVTTAPAVKARAERLRRDCTVCLLGACFLAFARLFDGPRAKKFLNVEDVADFEESPVYVSDAYKSEAVARRKMMLSTLRDADAFTQRDLDAMEVAFERDTDLIGNDLAWDSERRCDAALAFTEGVDNKVERVRLIMQNVIDNGGRFVPPPTIQD